MLFPCDFVKKKWKGRNYTATSHLLLALRFKKESRTVVEDGLCGIIPKGWSPVQNHQVQKRDENEKGLDFPGEKSFGRLGIF